MSFLLPKLSTKAEVDNAIKSAEDVVLVLRFGREDDAACLQMDDIVRKARVLFILILKKIIYN